MESARNGQAPGMRMLQLAAFMAVCSANPMDLTAQTTANRESVRRVIEKLFITASEDETLELAPGTWSVAIAQFAKGDSRAIEIAANVGEYYQVIGGSESWDTDVDICVYGPSGDELGCDTMEDNIPVVGFSARTEGVYRAVMTAASVDRQAPYGGMIVLRGRDASGENEDGESGGRSESGPSQTK